MAGGETGAFCPILREAELWRLSGGRTGSDGSPLIDPRIPVAGICSDPHDCHQCELMQNAQAQMYSQGVGTLWVCSDCAGEAMKNAKRLKISASLPGYYTEGYCQRPQCGRPGEGRDQNARYSTLLQLLSVAGPNIP